MLVSLKKVGFELNSGQRANEKKTHSGPIRNITLSLVRTYSQTESNEALVLISPEKNPVMRHLPSVYTRYVHFVD